ncbi:PREDICTED: nose resistant to fluoxetine protein 6-like [Trachymyrmex septentrionalis]|uniref:nose resistant to fluoxetine protein 6-like n=1 Tax=Trachymyrmex septentrionalis TaxID=34720 RepID=UPI00084F5A32|nr:PREDICTED: nose resistant to fluoxetine protein 6-like [Trachymyrmex septentrionalis]
MKSMRFKWKMYMSLLLIFIVEGRVAKRLRPEVVLADVLTKPFILGEFASFECVRDSKIYLEALKTYTPWALQMFDASGKIASGLITGNYRQLGNFDECLQVKNEHGFVGQACNVAVQFEISADHGTPREELDLGDLLVNVATASNATHWSFGNSVVYEWMFCVPSTCNHMEVQEFLEIALDPLKIAGRVDMTINVPKESCHTVETDRKTWDIVDWCYTSILILLLLIAITSTGYDVVVQQQTNTSKWKSIFMAFSMYKNGKKLLQTTDTREDSILCLYGLRCISMCWVIYGHTYYMEAVSNKMDLTQIPHMHNYWNNMFVLNGNIATDIFFLVSGMLLAYNELLRKERAGSNWRIHCIYYIIGLCVHRYIRVTPPYAMMIGFYGTLFDKFGTGLQWDTWVGSNKKFCRENWWTNLLYINNFVNVPNMCMSQSWYLSTDMQFVLLSPFILYPMLKFKTVFFAIVLAVYLFLSILVPFVITYVYQLTGTMLYYKEPMDLAQVYLKIYTKTYNRFGSYLIGVSLGYFIYKMRSYNVKLRIRYVICGWLLAIVAGFAMIFWPRYMYFDTYVYNRLEASFYAGFHRQIFVLSISWIIFCCIYGYAGPINYLLSWSGWLPLGKLSYCAYLCHYLFILSYAGATRTTGNLTQMNVMRAFFANLMFSMITSVLWSLCFEMPFITIDGILLSGRKENLSKDLRTNNSAASDKDICQPKESSTTHVNNDPKEHGCDATLHDVTKTAKQNDVQDEKINKTIPRIPIGDIRGSEILKSSEILEYLQ